MQKSSQQQKEKQKILSGKQFEELNLIDNFLFNTAIDHAQYGTIFAKTILETILQRTVRIGRINAERVILPPKPGWHGIRLDAYIEDNTADLFPGEVYNLEPDNKEWEKKHLPRRSRFYHSSIDSRLLRASSAYRDLPNTWVIFITSFDPFNEERMVYTIKNRCMELPDMEYEDGAVTLFLNAAGKPLDTPEKMVQLLHYICRTIPENACNPELKVLQECVDDIKQDPLIKEAYMTMGEYVQREREEAVMEERAKTEEERNTMINERDAALSERDAAVNERDAALSERDVAVSERDAAVNERDAAVSERDAAVSERDAAVSERDAAVSERDAAMQRVRELEAQLEDQKSRRPI